MPWQQTGHDGSAAQYPEWANEGHANALTGLTSQSFWALPARGHEAGVPRVPLGRLPHPEGGRQDRDQRRCQVRHHLRRLPHAARRTAPSRAPGTRSSTPQLTTTRAAATAATSASSATTARSRPARRASPGAEIHHPMKEMMDGYGAIDVPPFPSVHKGKCVQCHMPPTSCQPRQRAAGRQPHVQHHRAGGRGRGLADPGRHDATAARRRRRSPDGTPVITTTITVTWDSMPYSACSTCHNNNNGVKPSPQPVATTTATPISGRRARCG